jgi:hypothetical protein
MMCEGNISVRTSGRILQKRKSVVNDAVTICRQRAEVEGSKPLVLLVETALEHSPRASYAMFHDQKQFP